MSIIITIASAKGGASKTTLAVALAAAAPASVLLVDTDPSESAARWLQRLDDQQVRVTTARSAKALERVLETAEEDLVLIDTPPLYEDAPLVQAAVEASAVVLTPLNPSPADIERLELIQGAVGEQTWRVVVTQERAWTRLGRVLRDQLTEGGIPLLDHGLPFSEASRTAWGTTAPDPEAAAAIWEDLTK